MHETLHQLALEHELAPAQTRALWQLSGLHQPPPDVHRWLRTGLMLSAALLLGAGLVFWVAANWAAQSRMLRLHLLQATVALPMLVALAFAASRPVLRMALVLLGTLALGGLLAYIGITYQTGADAWELFATMQEQEEKLLNQKIAQKRTTTDSQQPAADLASTVAPRPTETRKSDTD